MWITSGPVENVVSTQSRSYRKSRFSGGIRQLSRDEATLRTK